MSSIFDRLGDKLRNYMDHYNDDVFSNDTNDYYDDEEEEPVEGGWHYSPGSDSFKSSYNYNNSQNADSDENESWFQKAYSKKNENQNQSRYNSSNERSSNWGDYFKFFTENAGSTKQRQSSQKVYAHSAELEKDFKKLGLNFGASLEECKAARTKLLKLYHPDRVTDEEVKKKYTVMSQLVNESFQRIKEYYESL